MNVLIQLNEHKMERLVLSSNGITEVGCESLIKYITGNSNLNTLWLDSNPIMSSGMSILYSGLINCGIRVLSIAGCELGDGGASIIRKLLCNNRSIKSLCLDENNIEDAGMEV